MQPTSLASPRVNATASTNPTATNVTIGDRTTSSEYTVKCRDGFVEVVDQDIELGTKAGRRDGGHPRDGLDTEPREGEPATAAPPHPIATVRATASVSARERPVGDAGVDPHHERGHDQQGRSVSNSTASPPNAQATDSAQRTPGLTRINAAQTHANRRPKAVLNTIDSTEYSAGNRTGTTTAHRAHPGRRRSTRRAPAPTSPARLMARITNGSPVG